MTSMDDGLIRGLWMGGWDGWNSIAWPFEVSIEELLITVK